MPRYVVAAPHGFCSVANPIRHCDRVANRAVDAIIAADTNRQISYVQLSDKLRMLNHDYNRPNTDDTPWRARLRESIIAHHPDFVFEIHSFPGDHEMYRTRWPGATSATSADVALFKSDDNAEWIELLAAKIRERAPAGAIVRVVKPWHPVAITDDVAMIKKTRSECVNIMHALIEFNEVAETTDIMARAVYSAVDDLVRSRIAAKKDSIFGGDSYTDKYVFDPEIMHPAAISDTTAVRSGFANISGFSTDVSGRTFVIMMLVLVFILLILIGLGGFMIGKFIIRMMRGDNFSQNMVIA